MRPVFEPSFNDMLKKKITLNADKCHFFKSTVTFSGFQLSSNEYQVDKSITDAITSFPTLNNHSDLRSFSEWPTSYLLPQIQSLSLLA